MLLQASFRGPPVSAVVYAADGRWAQHRSSGAVVTVQRVRRRLQIFRLTYLLIYLMFAVARRHADGDGICDVLRLLVRHCQFAVGHLLCLQHADQHDSDTQRTCKQILSVSAIQLQCVISVHGSILIISITTYYCYGIWLIF